MKCRGTSLVFSSYERIKFAGFKTREGLCLGN